VGLRNEVLRSIDFTRLDLSPDSAKSIAFQLGQTIALIEGVELYSKREIQERFSGLADLIGRVPGSQKALNDYRDELLEKIAGVYTRQKGNLNLLMYGNALAIKDWNQFARQCRGMIIDVAKERCVCFPMDKFFRFGEGPEVTREQVSLSTGVEVVEKVDGSMVSMYVHDGKISFSCKGNFDTDQSRRASEIAEKLPISQLQTDRYFHVFEVIYPENRFPRGLSIVDYGSREDLVLIAMRDRSTNESLPYSEVVKEAQRVGLSHPRVFSGSLADVFAKVDSDSGSLGHEGYVIRTTDTGKYFKLKYEGYKEVLRIVNEIRSDRFVREYSGLSPDDRQRTLEVPPDDIRKVAEAQLVKLEDIISGLYQYAVEVAARQPGSPKEFAAYVRTTVPADLQRLVFQIARKLPARDLLERAAVEVYDGRREMVQLSRQPEPIGNGKSLLGRSNEHTDHQSSTQELRESMREDQKRQMTKGREMNGQEQEFDPTLVKTLRTFYGLPEFPVSVEEAKQALDEAFGSQPIPPALIDYYLDTEPAETRSVKVFRLAEVRGGEMLPWVEKLLASADIDERIHGGWAMLHINEDRGLHLLRGEFTGAVSSIPRPDTALNSILTILRIECPSPKSLALYDELRAMSRGQGRK
ncbi:MAG: virus, partial [Pseudomonadota bacterium]